MPRIAKTARREISSIDRERIIGRHLGGQSNKAIAKDVGRSVSTIGRLIKKWQETGKTDNQKGRGRKAKYSQEQQENLLEVCFNNPRYTYYQLSYFMHNTSQYPKVCNSTIKRYLRVFRVQRFIALTTPVLLPRHLPLRLEWANGFNIAQLGLLVFSDEAGFMIDDCGGGRRK
ncbi:uncharacterized protein FA14DRAFT_177436 [Meira miltonrushii]|uniref:Transposase IS30-like HTH domain-containing protein n=1 Tax=Meira miltonrushii TaxID=1280837 RepID=A0A316VPS9_9BASI|nr:uncharacterized protein FA14DRAFT_177436 [Meira miltonrushii]PWN38161.1 hypothetical protein FA14DRAFT_177436 [Meira miltonrushii]